MGLATVETASIKVQDARSIRQCRFKVANKSEFFVIADEMPNSQVPLALRFLINKV